jgi:DNA-binding winged helix-turn-helix (wHTH) protein/predicted ATPase
MAANRQFAFGLFHFDARAGQLWREDREVKLTPRAAAVLHVLASRAPDLVTKQELLDCVWGGMAVSDDALTSCIQELRGALGDDARRPHTIETRHRRGYRFMIPVTASADGKSAAALPAAAEPEPARLVGRSAELAELAQGFDRARLGRRQVMLVTGDPGIGKSALADTFLARLRNAQAAEIAHGQCLDHHGVGEPYLPLIEALTRLAAGRDGTAVKEILHAQAPSWVAQMPSLWTRLNRSVWEGRGHATRERMMRELTLAIEAMASRAPLVLKLEDIHWSDASTLDWIAHVARRPEPARLLVLATFRPTDAAGAKLGLAGIVTELALHGWCREIALQPLGLDAVDVYLKARLGDGCGGPRLHEMAPLLLERTGGNPLFMTSIVNELIQREAQAPTAGVIVSIPQDVRRFIDRQIDQLESRDRDLLAVASVVRREFATATVAAALKVGIEPVENAFARLGRQGVFIVKSGSATWPDGTRTELYAFRHDLYRELLYDRLPATRRALSHARVGRWLETACGSQLDLIASELAEHFERAGEPTRAIPHHQRAAAKAMRRSANAEAIGHLQQALDDIRHVADETECRRIEAQLHIALGAAFIATKGFGAPEVLHAYARAEALGEGLGERTLIFPALWGQWLFRWGRSELGKAWRLCERLLKLAQQSGDDGHKLQAHHAAWATAFGRGMLADVHGHAEAGLAIYDAKRHQAMASSYGNHDAGTCARYFSALSLALAGEGERAREMADRSLAAANSLNDPFSLALSLFFASATAQVLGDVTAAAHYAEASRQIATEHDLAVATAWSTGVAGWCAAERGDPKRGIALLTEAIAMLRATHSLHFMLYLLGMLADAQIKGGDHGAAMKAVDEGLALAEAGGERYFLAELRRLQGELLALPPPRRGRQGASGVSCRRHDCQGARRRDP